MSYAKAYQGLDPRDYPHAYLITAARFAGYNFNPVSLWYLYSPHKILSAVILEVNNTFDERRPYILLRDVTDESRHTTHDQRLQITGTRVKDFHVSPFNSREGYYSVLTSDPLGPGMDGCRGIDVTITLNSSKGQPQLVASLRSEGPAVDPAFLGPLSKLNFVARWFWVGFITLPRIFWQAAILLYRRNLDMWNKPEPLLGTLGRHATSVEKSLELCFSKYLEFLVFRSEKPLSVKYYTSGLLSSTERIFTSSHGHDSGNDSDSEDDRDPEDDSDSQNDSMLELRVLTPAFYSRLVHYCNILDGINTELNIHKTVWVDRPELLPCIFGEISITTRSMSFSDFVFSSLLTRMRRTPPRITPDSTLEDPSRAGRAPVESKENPMSTMDAYFMFNETKEVKRRFQWATFRQLIADRCFMGRVEILDRIMDTVRVGIAWACIKSLTHIMRV